MLSTRGLMTLGCVVSAAVAIGIIAGGLALRAITTRGFLSDVPFGSKNGVINALRISSYPLVADKEDAAIIAGPFARGDLNAFGIARREMAGQGKVLDVANGTPVQLLEVDGPLARVRVFQGPLLNRSGWVALDVTSQPR